MEHTVLQDVTDDYSIIIPKVEHFLKGKFAKRVKETKHKLWLKNMIKTIFFTRTTLKDISILTSTDFHGAICYTELFGMSSM